MLVVDLWDSQIVVSKYKTGFLPPQDVPFEELTMTANSASVQRTAVPRDRKRPAIFGRFRSTKVMVRFPCDLGRESWSQKTEDPGLPDSKMLVVLHSCIVIIR